MRDPDDTLGDQDRVADMEARLKRLEHELSARGRSRMVLRRVVPDEAGTHFRAAAREHLLGMRALADYWIRRLDHEETESRAPEREEIPID